MVIGATYRTNCNEELVYIGRYPVYGTVYVFDGKVFPTYRKMELYAAKENKLLHEKEYRGWGGLYNYHNLYEEKIGVTGKQFWFAYKDDSGNWTVSHQSSASKLIDVVDESCHLEYAEIFDKMERNRDYSPYDKSKDEIVYYTYEEFLNQLNNWYYNCFDIEIDGASVYEPFILKENEPNKIFLYTYDAGESVKDIFFDRETGNYKGLPLKEFFETYRPHYKKLYLMNGKLWKTDESIYKYELINLEKEVIA